MGRDAVLFKLYSQVDFDEIRQHGTTEAKDVIDRLIKTGLGYFLEGPHVIYKNAVEEFFKTATVSYDRILATVCGSQIEITEAVVAESLHLPTTGMDATAEMDDDVFKMACHRVSATNKPVPTSGKKQLLKPELIPACDVFARAILGKLEIRQEIERLEAICNQKQVPVYTAPVIEDFQIDWTTEDTVTPRDIETPLPENDEVPTSKSVEVQTLEDAVPNPDDAVQDLEAEIPTLGVEAPNSEIEVINLEDSAQLEPPNEEEAPINLDERADPDPTKQSHPTPPPVVTAPAPPQEWIDDLFQKFEVVVSKRIEDRLRQFDTSISEKIDDRILDHNVSKLQPLKDRCENIFDTAMKFANATKLVVDHTQTRLEQLSTGLWEEAGERENCAQHIAALEGLTSELKKDFERERLDAEVSRDKEAPRATQLTEEEIEAERIRRAESMYPGYAEQIARQAADDAERLERQKRGLEEFSEANKKKKKVAPSASAPAASASEPKKRKKPTSKKVRIVETLNIISDPVETGW
ncbi:uncharacterized protein LOC124943440 [Impatiens glandulifera]|uniref:uncharacterized protein LOC124943440 n=1 Tax=Impatiens glandulifera TaxID=253017 RepID=UPI001FB0E233|nr:uncharacterized protein LOC124943440 [Impatiens glandulifera]